MKRLLAVLIALLLMLTVGLAEEEFIAAEEEIFASEEALIPEEALEAIEETAPIEAEPEMEPVEESRELAVVESGTCGRGVSWALYDNGRLAITGAGEMTDYEPSGAPWYGRSGKIKKVAIDNSVRSIGTYAFYYCIQLDSVTIGSSVKRIGEGAFSLCYTLTGVRIPDSVTSIGKEAFNDCRGMASVTIGSGLRSIGEGAFKECTELESVRIPDSVTSIGKEAFYRCIAMTSLTIGTGVTSIEECAFSHCAALTCVRIPDSVTSIGKEAFYNCFIMTSVTIGSGLRSIGEGAFKECNALTGVRIPDSVTSIGKEAFYNCCSMTSVTIGSGLRSIEEGVFKECNLLHSIRIPDGVTSISDDAFDTWRIRTVIIPTCNSYAHNWAKEHLSASIEVEQHQGSAVIDAAVEPTCTGTGLTAGSHCPACGAVFVRQEEVPALGHDWGKAAYTWAEDNRTVTASRTCTRNHAHVDQETANVTAVVTREPTWFEMGETTYTSDPFENEAFKVQQKTLTDVEKVQIDKVTGIQGAPVDTNAARVNWDTLAGVTGYQLFRADNGGDFRWVKNVETATVSNYSLTPGADYRYRVRAYAEDANGYRAYGLFSDVVSVHILGTIDHFTVTGKDTNCAFLKWDRVDGCTGYQVFRTVAGSGEYQWIKNASTPQVANYALTPGTTYYYKLRAYIDLPGGKRAYGQFSEGVKVSIQPQVNVTLQGGTRQITIAWDKADGCTGYQIFYTEAGTGGVYAWWKNVPAGTLSATLTGLKANTDYWFKVRSYVDLPDGRYYGQLSEAKHVMTLK